MSCRTSGSTRRSSSCARSATPTAAGRSSTRTRARSSSRSTTARASRAAGTRCGRCGSCAGTRPGGDPCHRAPLPSAHGVMTDFEYREEPRPMASAPIILVPGFWLGAWAWDEVAATASRRRPRRHGDHAARAWSPRTRTAPRSRSRTTSTRSSTPSRPPSRPAVLAVHSATGFSGYAASDRVPERIAAMVYVDTAPGKPPLDPDSRRARSRWSGTEIEAEENLDGLSEEQQATFRERAVPVPGGIAPRPVRRSPTTPAGTSPRRSSRPATRPRTTRSTPSEPPVPSFLAGLPELRNVTWVDLPTSHWPMWSKPAETRQDHRRRRDDGRRQATG